MVWGPPYTLHGKVRGLGVYRVGSGRRGFGVGGIRPCGAGGCGGAKVFFGGKGWCQMEGAK
jgi:hypothetical protein